MDPNKPFLLQVALVKVLCHSNMKVTRMGAVRHLEWETERCIQSSPYRPYPWAGTFFMERELTILVWPERW